ncbi:KdsC family phosphatase [Adhaeribacter radiodurans]|uniref:HAD-IIIA family hydrolase n=1 Tax=Adhaeribacter radiodurans TaxID=2745197 RepID=A0A7L7LF18_9BACT|nr:HAD-IIIA family hydrolase [Adhaeribacter radiodurans]QMU31420.1 HAD-IIIA family hydrolase [Adhaeribacter radiodurans]
MNEQPNFSNSKAFIFDVDGVLTDGLLYCLASGEQVRAFNIKDGYAIRHAIKKGYVVAIISGRKEEGVYKRLRSLDVEHIYLGVENKAQVFAAFLEEQNLLAEHIVYMGDDVPDLEVMQKCGIAACPADAVSDIKKVCHYVSEVPGGKGAVRDLIETVLKTHSNW